MDTRNFNNQVKKSSAASLQPVRIFSDKAKDLLRQRLFHFTLESYSSSFSTQLINENVKLGEYMDSVQAIEQHLPVFSKDHANKVIYNLIRGNNIIRGKCGRQHIEGVLVITIKRLHTLQRNTHITA